VIEANLRRNGNTAPIVAGSMWGFSAHYNRQFHFPNDAAVNELMKSHGAHSGRLGGVLPLMRKEQEDGSVKVELLCASPLGGDDVAQEVADFSEHCWSVHQLAPELRLRQGLRPHA
ncbi:MAG: hypothetical protein AAF658_15455, partial [Myxococcota bacterium]